MTVNQLIQMLQDILIENPKIGYIANIYQDSGNSIHSWRIDDDGDIVLTDGDN
jgi:hypothetical protein